MKTDRNKRKRVEHRSPVQQVEKFQRSSSPCLSQHDGKMEIGFGRTASDSRSCESPRAYGSGPLSSDCCAVALRSTSSGQESLSRPLPHASLSNVKMARSPLHCSNANWSPRSPFSSTSSQYRSPAECKTEDEDKGKLLVLGSSTCRPLTVLSSIDSSVPSQTEICLSSRQLRDKGVEEVLVTVEMDPDKPTELLLCSESNETDIDARLREKLLNVQNEVQHRQKELEVMGPELQELTRQLADCEEDEISELQEDLTRQARIAGLHRRRIAELRAQCELQVEHTLTSRQTRVTLQAGVPHMTPWLPHPLIYIPPPQPAQTSSSTKVTKQVAKVPLEVQGKFQTRLKVACAFAITCSPDGKTLYALDRAKQSINVFNTSDCSLVSSFPVQDEVFSLAASNTRLYATGVEQAVRVYSLQGKALQAWGSHGQGDEQFDSPTGLAVSDSHVYVSDSLNSRVQVYDLGGQFVTSWRGPDLFQYPFGIAVNGSCVFVTDSVLNCVKVFHTNGALLRQWGSAGKQDGQFDQPSGIAVSGPFVYVADSRNQRVQVFDQQGKFVRVWLCREPSGPAGPFRPMGLALVPNQCAFVSAMDAQEGISLFH
eukprot:g78173.t1